MAAAVVILPADAAIARSLEPVRDSKLLTPHARDRCYDLVVRCATDYGVGLVSAEEIDRIGILPATRQAMQLALAALARPPDVLLIDALRLPAIALPQEALIKGDRLCLSIAAASILAKVTRDRWMTALDAQLPGYGFARHKGYGTRAHVAALHTAGSSSQHRHSFAPVRAIDEARYG